MNILVSLIVLLNGLSLWAAKVELNLPVLQTPLKLGIQWDLEGTLRTSAPSAISPVVRIESQGNVGGDGELYRWGTGVIIGRYRQNTGSFLKGTQGFLVLTANHVLLDAMVGGEPLSQPQNQLQSQTQGFEQKVTLFTNDRRAKTHLDFHIVSVRAGEDLALIEVPVASFEEFALDLPKLGLLDPETFNQFTWTPRYTRMNPGQTGQIDLTYSDLTLNMATSMVTRDALNALAPLVDAFWYIGGDFTPGMSGGPVWAQQVKDGQGQWQQGLEQVVLGVMGYIFDRESQYGYAYPLTKNSLEGLFSEANGQMRVVEKIKLSLQVANERAKVIEPQLMLFQVTKKQAPDQSVADELSLSLVPWMDSPNGGGGDFFSLHVRQKNEFRLVGREQLLEKLKLNPWTKLLGGAQSTPGGGGTNGTPGGGGTNGSPGGGGTNGSPGGNSDNRGSGGALPVATFELESWMQVIHTSREIDPSGQEKLVPHNYRMQRIAIEQKSYKLEHLKDLYRSLMSRQPITLILEPLQPVSKAVIEASGKLNLNPLHSQLKSLQSLGQLVWNSQKFKVRSLKGDSGLSLKLNTQFRDTKTGITRRLEVTLGLRLEAGANGAAEGLLSRWQVEAGPIEEVEGLRYVYLNNLVQVYSGDHLVLEVKL
jgi:uncharacterized membrane protein YgcG